MTIDGISVLVSSASAAGSVSADLVARTQAARGEAAASALFGHSCGDPECAARQLGDTRAVAKGHYIGVPETVPDNRDVLERWPLGNKPEV
ncbi:hypothetical protein [Nocardia abscessus]|uniref:hypothetical protein n=1 Tax=Nocardia abscessus TaxID=120957 RepID=UPI002453CA4B|nr:hypothetical protein [Nocardia abscessus]